MSTMVVLLDEGHVGFRSWGFKVSCISDNMSLQNGVEVRDEADVLSVELPRTVMETVQEYSCQLGESVSSDSDRFSSNTLRLSVHRGTVVLSTVSI